jgi:hypothetical protein
MNHVDICRYLEDAAVYIRSRAGYYIQTIITILRFEMGCSIRNTYRVREQGINWMNEFPDADYFSEDGDLGHWIRNIETVTRLTFFGCCSEDEMHKLFRRARFAAYYMHVLGYSELPSMIFYTRWCNFHFHASNDMLYSRYIVRQQGNQGGVKFVEQKVSANGDVDPLPTYEPLEMSHLFTYWEIWEITLFYIETRMYARLVQGNMQERRMRVGKYIHSIDEYHLNLSDLFKTKDSPIKYYKDESGAEKMICDTFFDWIYKPRDTLFIRRNRDIVHEMSLS